MQLRCFGCLSWTLWHFILTAALQIVYTAEKIRMDCIKSNKWVNLSEQNFLVALLQSIIIMKESDLIVWVTPSTVSAFDNVLLQTNCEVLGVEIVARKLVEVLHVVKVKSD